ncbi:MAG: glutamate-1-semialdehyde 2,1-aminomutase [Flavobacteriales bacterium]|jgi:glutamate-1-semialdehyde 2,1-aminomutase|nr:glutamate-1-semialdehyde 2,1-aminomutase [Flavobacteriales bacterium]MDG1440216.1 glutamate-1-semialdehyde 2,1-aminomutase [Flavobacteriales bacterium]MDG1798735.1 glutamate-1-semialdehyde 2,1-aminomutase [Flavobacteriales bacterium]
MFKLINERSKKLFEEAKKVIPGGVNSPVRAFKSVGGSPIFIKEAKGAYLYDEDGNKYIDYISSWGPMIIGHAHPEIINAVENQSRKGTSYGIPTELETKMAELVVSLAPNVDKIRFVNSGTEACMSAIRLARGYTKRDKIIKFSGCYHGHSDSFLIQAGSGASTFGVPNSPGVTKATASDTLLASFNDIGQVKDLFKEYKNEIAAVIVEPIAGNMGCVLPESDFILELRKLCDQHNTVLVFDEVMTGFRLGLGGAQEILGVDADLVTYGKVIGGGLPVGAFGGREDIMNFLAPDGPVYQAGTLSGNPIAMSAGYAMLNYLKNNTSIYESLDSKTIYLREGLESVLKTNKLPFHINSIGSMISLHFTNSHVVNFETAQQGDNKYFKNYFHGMLANGVYLPPSAYESYFLNDAITFSDIDDTIKSFEKIASKI